MTVKTEPDTPTPDSDIRLELCWQCGKHAKHFCSHKDCPNQVCVVHCVPVMRAADKAKGVLCAEHSTEQIERPADAPSTIWVRHPFRRNEPAIEIEYEHDTLVPLLIAGYKQTDPPATSELPAPTETTETTEPTTTKEKE